MWGKKIQPNIFITVYLEVHHSFVLSVRALAVILLAGTVPDPTSPSAIAYTQQ